MKPETDTATATLLADILLELRRQRIPDALWSTEEIGVYFGCTAKRACAIVSHPKFPNPVSAPELGRRWIPDEVKAWARLHRAAKRRVA